MENINAFKETVDRFLGDFDKIKTIESLNDLSKHELAMVRELQLIQVQVGNASRDLYMAIQAHKAELVSGKTTKTKTVVDTVKKVVKKATKAKKADK